MNLRIELSPHAPSPGGYLLLGFVTLSAALAVGSGTALATGDPEGGAPSYRISQLDDGKRLVEWASQTNWESVVDETSDIGVLSVPGKNGDYTNALVLGPKVGLEDLLEEIDEVEEEQQRGPLLRYDLNGSIVYPGGTVFPWGPVEYRGQTGERKDEEPEEEKGPDLSSPEKPPKIYGEEIDDEETLELSYKFFAGDSNPKKAKSRVKAARKHYVKAFDWWAKQINDTCEFDVAMQDLGDDFDTLTHVVALKGKRRQQAKRQKKPLTKKVGYRNYTTEEPWAKAPKESWLIGAQKRNALLRSPNPGTRFHLAIFHVNGIAFREDGEKRNVEHVLFKPAIGILRRPAQKKDKTATHETGHFLGLKDGDGGIMAYASQASRRGGSLYGPKKFLKRWCDTIEANIRGPV